MIEGNLSFVRDTYTQRKHEIGQHLKRGIEGLTLAMEYFSIKGHLASLPLSVLVPTPPLSSIQINDVWRLT